MYTHPMIRAAALTVLLAFSASAALAQPILRTIPADAKRGVMSPVHGMTVEIDDKKFELAAGAQIRDGRNMILVPTAVPRDAVVRYQLNPDGKVRRAWILTPQEAAQPDPKK